MNDYHVTSTAWGQEQRFKVSNRQSSERESSLARLVHRQPELLLAGAVIGGALLAFLRQKNSHSNDQPAYPAPNRSWRPTPEAPHHTPSARTGATEEQMQPASKQPLPMTEAKTTGTTGTVYEMDRASITPG